MSREQESTPTDSTVTNYESPEGFHRHKCPNCNYIWEHSNNCVGNISAHRCPRCETIEGRKYTGTLPPSTRT